VNVVIVGNGTAAVSAVEAIRKNGDNSDITIVSKEKEPAYTPCFLPKYISGEIKKEGLHIRGDRFYEENRVEVLLGNPATEIQPGDNTVKLLDGKEFSYDRLLLATGSRPIVPDVPGIDGKGVFFFSNLTDTEKIIKKSRAGAEVLIMGSGFIAMELAEALWKRGMKVTVAARKGRILRRMLDKEVAEIVEEHAKKEGIRIIKGREITSIKRSMIMGQLEGAVLDNGDVVPCDMLVVSIGVRPNLEVLEKSPIKFEKGVLTDDRLCTNIPNIFAAGDIAEMDINGVRKVNAVHINAARGGDIAGHNIIGIDRRFESHLDDMNALNLFGLPVISLGQQEGERVLRSDSSRGMIKIYESGDGMINGVELLGDVMKAGVYLSLMKRRIPVGKVPRILSPGFNYGETLLTA